jgi:hypothetical protein
MDGRMVGWSDDIGIYIYLHTYLCLYLCLSIDLDMDILTAYVCVYVRRSECARRMHSSVRARPCA